MSKAPPKTLAVVGAGAMGGQIAFQAALHGYDVHLVSRKPERLQTACTDNGELLRRRVEKGKLGAEECEAALARVQASTDLSHIGGCSVVLESVAEDREVKREVLQRISENADVDAIIGTNSSTLSSSLFEQDVRNPQRLLNVHFFNPPLVMQLVEVVRGEHTADATVEAAMRFVSDIGKTPVLVTKETYGFIANRILFIAMQEAFRLVQGGFVTVEDCDLAVRNGLGWPMGPFELADLVGLDVVEAILAEGHAQTGEDRWTPPAILSERVRRGDLGKKSGSGFRT
ncbi:MAG: 3-hydroxyacyl-CoA dehydrogenase family protein [Candidatus Dormibacteraeota bacterium]|nr:3-hydroxyacyl-CoA dehydrogenase family protein [Candidatus Dormibacteraeota bacterium]MBV8445641.1 3-hydroxyacyl-CoA dehydrogenase family protein [Candidatus Dormibacteraeota bacterium]